MARICWLSDFDISGSGYLNISIPLCNELSKLGHEIKAIGYGYKGQEHSNLFGIIPARDFNDVLAITQNLVNKWTFDIFVCALDIPHQEKLLSAMNQRTFKYIGIMPVEAGPLCISWAMALMTMDKVFIISEYGTQEAKKSAVQAEHIQIGIDCDAWKIPTQEEKLNLRHSLGIDDDTFVVLTVADNQERKNPHRLIETYAEFSKGKKTKYILVTREWNPAGGRLRDYAQEWGVHQHFILMERGMPFKQLWGLYAMSDVFLLASKSEGLGMPLLEAMAVGLPVVATNCTAISELLADGRGLLVDPEYQHRDCFGNGWRYWFSKKHGVEMLNKVYEEGFDTKPAREYVEKRTWDIPALQMDNAIKELLK
jgi:glycosyltransferase involved in cell wall biosynthesis